MSSLEDVPARILDQAAGAFGALASPVRLRILQVLARGESDATGLTDQVGGAPSAVSHHLSVLRRTGVVGVRRDGRRRLYSIDDLAVLLVVRFMMERHLRPQGLAGSKP